MQLRLPAAAVSSSSSLQTSSGHRANACHMTCRLHSYLQHCPQTSIAATKTLEVQWDESSKGPNLAIMLEVLHSSVAHAGPRALDVQPVPNLRDSFFHIGGPVVTNLRGPTLLWRQQEQKNTCTYHNKHFVGHTILPFLKFDSGPAEQCHITILSLTFAVHFLSYLNEEPCLLHSITCYTL